MASPHYIVSDIHLGAVPDRTERAFVRFLEHAGREAGSLLVNGDLFDFWFEYGEVIPGRHFRVLAALADVVEGGVRVVMVGGNHDAWGGGFLRDEVGIELVDGHYRTRFAGRRALVAHGDGLGRGDIKYRLLKAALRSRGAVWGFRALHPELGVRLARAVSSTEVRGMDERAVAGRAAFLRDWAGERLAEDPELAYVVCGHAHLPEVTEVEPGRYYINAGDWIEHFTYVTIDASGEPSLHRWDQAARS